MSRVSFVDVKTKQELSELVSKVAKLEEAKIKKYGVKWLHSASSPACERIYDSVGKVALAAVGNGEVQNDFLSIYPFNKMRPCNLNDAVQVTAYLGEPGFDWNGATGDVMLEVPLFFERRLQTLEYEEYSICELPIAGYYPSPPFVEGNKILNKIYLPIFHGSYDGTKLRSVAGALPAVSTPRNTFRTQAKNRGVNSKRWALDDVRNTMMIQYLFYLMFANRNSQAVLGNDVSSMIYNSSHPAILTEVGVNRIVLANDKAINFNVGEVIDIATTHGNRNVVKDRNITAKNALVDGLNTEIIFDGAPANITAGNVLYHPAQRTGPTITMASPCGRPEGINGRFPNRFMYLEGYTGGNVFKNCDGAIIVDRVAYLCDEMVNYSDDYLDGHYKPLGYVNGAVNGYPKKMGFDQQNPSYAFPIEIGAGTNTWFSDYYYQDAGVRSLPFGGAFYAGSYGGVSYWALNYPLLDSALNIGARPQAK